MAIQPVNCNLWKRPFSSLACLCNPDECHLDIRVNVCPVCPVCPGMVVKSNSLTHCFQSYFSSKCQSLNLSFVVLGIQSRTCTYSASAPPLSYLPTILHIAMLYLCVGGAHMPWHACGAQKKTSGVGPHLLSYGFSSCSLPFGLQTQLTTCDFCIGSGDADSNPYIPMARASH